MIFLALAANPKAVSSAWMLLLEYGALGAMLVIILGAFLFFQLKATNRVEKRLDQMREDAIEKSGRTDKILKDKDDKLEKVNEKLNKVAIDAVKVGTMTGERQNQLIGLVEDILGLLRKGKGHDGSDTNERRADGDNPSG